ncbi:MAG: hypothetical protein JSV68_12790 [Anaerolineaceae bacterium]|nr:MAG: hypothetical protein JSV68_12790 [Anaerolineaceae bacterium]
MIWADTWPLTAVRTRVMKSGAAVGKAIMGHNRYQVESAATGCENDNGCFELGGTLTSEEDSSQQAGEVSSLRAWVRPHSSGTEPEIICSPAFSH